MTRFYRMTVFGGMIIGLALLVGFGTARAREVSKLYFPHIACKNGWNTTISLINTHPSLDVSGRLHVFDAAGTPVTDAAEVALPSHGKAAYRMNADFDDADRIAYAIFETEAQGETVVGHLEFFIEGQYRAAVPAVSRVNTGDIHVSHIPDSANWWTGIGLVNTTSAAKSLTFVFNDGAQRSVSLGPGAHQAFTIASLFAGAVPPTVSSARIENADGIIGLELFGRGNQLGGILLSDRTESAILYPHLAAGPDWWTGLLALNPTDAPGAITIAPFRADGTPLTPWSRTLAPRERFVGTPEALGFSSDAAWFRLESSDPVVGFALHGTHDEQLLGGYVPMGLETRTGILPKWESTGWSGAALVNPSPDPQTVLLTAYRSNGAAAGFASLELDGMAKSVGVIPSLFSESLEEAAYLEFSAPNPVAGIQLNGSGDGRLLDALPALPGNPSAAVGFPDEFIWHGWDREYQITELFHGNGAWGMVMSQEVRHWQSWYTDSDVPENRIQEAEADGDDLSMLAYGDGEWAAVFTDRTDYAQERLRSDGFPPPELHGLWDAGYRITDLSHAEGQWSVILSQGTKLSRQSWMTDSVFPEEAVSRYWADGFDITDVAYGDGMWTVVMSDGLDWPQTYGIRDEFPLDFIRRNWADGFRVTDLATDGSRWAAVLSRDAGLFGQKLKYGYTVAEVASDCSVSAQNEYLYRLMKERYFWNDRVPDKNFDLYASPETLLDALRYDALDPWSYVEEQEDFERYYEEGVDMGLGFGVRYDADGNRRISYVYRDSPAGKAGLQRGDVTLAINGKTIAEINREGLWDTIHGPDEIGALYRLRVRDAQGNVREVPLIRDLYPINTVLRHEVLNIRGRRVGYLVFRTFSYPAERELDAVFADFAAAGVEALILDLRYNTGGRLDIAQNLASRIAGEAAAGDLFFTKAYNGDRENRNEAGHFVSLENSLSLERLVVIATSSTCSASELIINGLRPYMDVFVVGDVTCGKPVGMEGGYNFCGQHFSVVTFQVRNARGEGDYFDGIFPHCYAADDVSRSFGDPEEASLRAAISVLTDGICPAPDQSLRARRRDVERTEPEFTGFDWIRDSF